MFYFWSITTFDHHWQWEATHIQLPTTIKPIRLYSIYRIDETFLRFQRFQSPTPSAADQSSQDCSFSTRAWAGHALNLTCPLFTRNGDSTLRAPNETTNPFGSSLYAQRVKIPFQLRELRSLIFVTIAIFNQPNDHAYFGAEWAYCLRCILWPRPLPLRPLPRVSAQVWPVYCVLLCGSGPLMPVTRAASSPK